MDVGIHCDRIPVAVFDGLSRRFKHSHEFRVYPRSFQAPLLLAGGEGDGHPLGAFLDAEVGDVSVYHAVFIAEATFLCAFQEKVARRWGPTAQTSDTVRDISRIVARNRLMRGTTVLSAIN